jgi:outer membrane lipoprotein-sorting protein
MKKLLVISLIILGFSDLTSAQTDAKAKSILANVSRKYRSYDLVKTDFTYTVENPQADTRESQKGTLYVKSKTNKYKVVLKEHEVISDGKTLWTYLKSDKEVQLNDIDNDPNILNPAKIFTIYEKGFKYIYTGDTKVNGRVNHVIELTPVDTKRSFYKIRLNIDKLNSQITKALIFDKNGNRYTYTIDSFVPNYKVSESIFAFDPKQHPGVEVVDLR